jgi:hypothetical protein
MCRQIPIFLPFSKSWQGHYHPQRKILEVGGISLPWLVLAHTQFNLMAFYMTGEQQIDKYLSRVALLNTDDYIWLEHRIPIKLIFRHFPMPTCWKHG